MEDNVGVWSIVKLLADKFACDVFAPDMIN
jgi:hypothetical protein